MAKIVEERIPFDEIETRGIETYAGGYEISKSTPLPLQKAMINLLECLLDINYRFPAGKYKKFEVTEDLFNSERNYGDASGKGTINGIYRSLRIEYKGKEKIVSIGVLAFATCNKPDVDRTYICVAVDNRQSLQLNVDRNVKINGDIVEFYHDGKITVSNVGSGKISKLREFVEEEYPEIICNKRFFLGELKNNRLWNISDEEVVKFIENLISYALIRDKYKEYRKKEKAKE